MTAIEGWVEKPLSEIADITSGQSPDSKFYTDDEVGMPFLQGCAEFTTKYPIAKLNCLQIKKIGKAGSILFSVRAPVGNINIADRDYIIGRGLASILATAVDPVFLEQCLAYLEPQFRAASQGSTFEAINSKELSAWLIRLPSDPKEQTQIATVLYTLDQAIEQTGAIIAKQQRIMVGLMQDLLTKGIDEDGIIRSEATHEFKDSPQGRIPVEWEVKNLESCVRSDSPICYGILMPGSGFDNGIPVIKVKDIFNGKICQDNILLTDPKIDREYKRSRLIEGDLLMTIRGTTGRIALVPKTLHAANITQDTARIRLKPEHLNAFHYFLLQSRNIQDQVKLHTLGQAVKGINIAEVRRISLALPEKAEQERISIRLTHANRFLEAAMDNRLKLRLQKRGLMNDLLTGKVRVNDKIKQLTAN